MKKIFNFTLALTLAVSLVGCGNSSNESGSEIENTPSSVESESESENSSAGESEEEQEETTSAESPFLLIDGLYMPLPKGFTREEDDKMLDAFYYYVHSGLSSANDKIYYNFYDDISYGTWDSDLENFTCKDVVDMGIMSTDQEGLIRVVFDNFLEKTVETEEDVEVNGYPFIKQTGTIKAAYDDESTFASKDPADQVTVYYITYYGAMNLKEANDRNIPMMWYCFSEAKDESTKTEMADIMTECMAGVKFSEEEEIS